MGTKNKDELMAMFATCKSETLKAALATISEAASENILARYAKMKFNFEEALDQLDPNSIYNQCEFLSSQDKIERVIGLIVNDDDEKVREIFNEIIAQKNVAALNNNSSNPVDAEKTTNLIARIDSQILQAALREYGLKSDVTEADIDKMNAIINKAHFGEDKKNEFHEPFIKQWCAISSVDKVEDQRLASIRGLPRKIAAEKASIKNNVSTQAATAIPDKTAGITMRIFAGFEKIKASLSHARTVVSAWFSNTREKYFAQKTELNNAQSAHDSPDSRVSAPTPNAIAVISTQTTSTPNILTKLAKKPENPHLLAAELASYPDSDLAAELISQAPLPQFVTTTSIVAAPPMPIQATEPSGVSPATLPTQIGSSGWLSEAEYHKKYARFIENLNIEHLIAAPGDTKIAYSQAEKNRYQVNVVNPAANAKHDGVYVEHVNNKGDYTIRALQLPQAVDKTTIIKNMLPNINIEDNKTLVALLHDYEKILIQQSDSTASKEKITRFLTDQGIANPSVAAEKLINDCAAISKQFINPDSIETIPANSYLDFADKQITTFFAMFNNDKDKYVFIKPNQDPLLVQAYQLICSAKGFKYNDESGIEYKPTKEAIDYVNKIQNTNNSINEQSAISAHSNNNPFNISFRRS